MVKLQTLHRQFKFLTMDKNETISKYFDKIQEHINAIRVCKDNITYQQVVDKVLRTLSPKFDHVVAIIEEIRDLDTMEVEELQHSLEAHEFQINERSHVQEQTLLARTSAKHKEFKKVSQLKKN